MSDHEKFKQDCQAEIASQGNDSTLRALTSQWILRAAAHKYSYHFEWLGRPVIQHPQDLLGMQQLIWQVQPDLVIETGIARGGSLIFSASILELVAMCGGNAQAKVLGVDIDIREHNREAIMAHPMFKRISMIEGSSTDANTAAQVHEVARTHSRIMVFLDSNHTHEHVLEELRLYAPLVSKGSYCVVFDTVIADMPADSFPDRPWTKSANPKSAVQAYLRELDCSSEQAADGRRLAFSIDKQIESQLLITVAPDGFLRRA